MANRIRGITVEINGDTTNLQKSLSGVDKSIGKTQSQLKDVEKLLKLDPTNTELLSQKQRLLGEAVKDTKERLESLKTASEEAAKTKDNYDAWKAKYDPIKKEIGETETKLKELKEQVKTADEQLSKGEISQEKYDALQREVKETTDELTSLKQQAKDVSDEFGHPISQEQYDAIQREIIDTEHELQNLQREAESSRTALVQIGNAGEGLQKVGEKISGAGEALMPVTAGILGLGVATVKTGAEFDAEMSKVSAISGTVADEDLPAIIESAEAMGLSFEEGATATETAMNILRAKARQMGSETKFSATEAGQAFEYMAMAGWGVEDMLNGVDGVMNLAAASSEELGTASDIVTDALTALGYQAEDAGHFSDVLAAASSNANTNVALMGESFKYCAPLAGAMKVKMEDLAVVLGLMANAGIKGSQAGTTLNSALTELFKDQTGEKLAAMSRLGFVETEQVIEVDESKVLKARAKLEKQTNNLEKAQISYNDAVEQYGETSSKAQKAALNLENIRIEKELAQAELESAMQGEVKEVAVGANVFVNEDGSVKELAEITDILREKMKAINVDLVDSEGNLREYDDIMAELSQTEEGLTQAQQLQDAAVIFGKRNLSGMLAIINASDEDYKKLTEEINNCDGTAQSMAETMQDNLEGQLTILKSQLEELAISFAEILMPAIRNIVTKIQELVDKFNALSPAQKETIAKIALVVAAIGPLLIVIGKLTTGIGGMMIVFSKMPAIMTKIKGGFTAVKTAIMGISAPVVAIAAVIAILVAAFKHLWETNEDFRNNIIAIWDGIKATFENLTSGIVDRLNALGFDFEDFTETLKYVWDWFCNYLAPIFENTFRYIGDILSDAVDIILGIVDFFIGLFTGNWEQCWNGIKEMFIGVWDAIVSTVGTFFEIIFNLFDTNLEEVLSYWTVGWNSIKNFFVNIGTSICNFCSGMWEQIQITMYGFFDDTIAGWNSIRDFFVNIFTSIRDFFVNTWNEFQDSFQIGMDAICTGFTNGWAAIQNFFVGIFTAIKDFFVNSWNNIKNTVFNTMDAIKTNVTNIWNNIKSSISGTISDIKDTVVNGFNNAVNFVKNLASESGNWGSDIIKGIVDGIKSKIGDITDAVTGVADKIRSFLHFSVPDEGPLTDFESWMPDFMQGLADGITANATMVNDALNTFGNNVTTALTDTFRSAMSNIVVNVKTFVQSIFTEISNALEKLKTATNSHLSTISSDVKTVLNTIQNCVLRVWDNVNNGVSNRILRIRNAIADGLNSSADCIRNLINQAWDWGYDLMQNLINGINYQMGSLGNIVSDVANMIWEYLHFSVPEKGPLTDFESWMPDFMQGLAKGIESSQKAVEKAISGVATAMQLTLDSGLDFGLNGISGAFTGNAGTVNNYYSTDNSRTVNQTNNSPKSLSRLEIYRQTRNALGV